MAHGAGLALALGLLAMAPAGAVAQEAPAEEAAATVRVELNRLEPVANACQPYLVFENRTAYALSSLKLDLVLFDADGIVADRLAVEAAPRPAGKTSLVVFQVPSLACDAIGSVLLNGVLACAGASVSDGACIDLVETGSRVTVPFFK
jgi:hypothetical protein